MEASMRDDPLEYGVTVVPLRKELATSAGHVLARAFQDDPVSTYILADPARRLRAQTLMMTATVRFGLDCGDVYATDGDVLGIAAWLRPGQPLLNWRTMVRSGKLRASLAFGLSGFIRLIRFTGEMEHLHQRDCPEPHWYLGLLAVDPPYQGRGIGSALIQPVLARADREGVRCYLETFQPRNVRFYQRHGFQVVVADRLFHGGPSFWTMARPPGRNQR